MSAPICKHGHHPVHIQRWRQKPWAVVDDRLYRRYWCPSCHRFTFVDHIKFPASPPKHVQRPARQTRRNPWWRVL